MRNRNVEHFDHHNRTDTHADTCRAFSQPRNQSISHASLSSAMKER